MCYLLWLAVVAVGGLLLASARVVEAWWALRDGGHGSVRCRLALQQLARLG